MKPLYHVTAANKFSALSFVLFAYSGEVGGWRTSRPRRTSRFGLQNRHAEPGRGSHFGHYDNARYSIPNQANLETFIDEAGIANYVVLQVGFLNPKTKATLRLDTNRNAAV